MVTPRELEASLTNREQQLKDVCVALEELERQHADAFFRQEAKDIEDKIFQLKKEEKRLRRCDR